MSEDKIDRYKLQPALAHAAEAACSYFLTDGFCSPRQCQQCKCWDAARAVMDATGLSARAVGFVFQHRSQIEAAAEQQETKTWNGTPWWSKPDALARDDANRPCDHDWSKWAYQSGHTKGDFRPHHAISRTCRKCRVSECVEAET